MEIYYRETLEDQGWYFRKRESRLSKTRVIFCRDNDVEETAVLELPDRVAERDYRYSLKIGWGINYGCD